MSFKCQLFKANSHQFEFIEFYSKIEELYQQRRELKKSQNATRVSKVNFTLYIKSSACLGENTSWKCWRRQSPAKRLLRFCSLACQNGYKSITTLFCLSASVEEGNNRESRQPSETSILCSLCPCVSSSGLLWERWLAETQVLWERMCVLWWVFCGVDFGMVLRVSNTKLWVF